MVGSLCDHDNEPNAHQQGGVGDRKGPQSFKEPFQEPFLRSLSRA